MRPPSWALANGVRLDLEGFGTQFACAWSQMKRRFLKLECWQTYQEREAGASQAAYDSGDVELLSYRIRVALGENIEIVRCDAGLHIPNERFFDVLLFDEHTALVHDYGIGAVGRQTGGWCTREAGVIAAMVDTITALRRRAMPLPAYLADV